MNDTHPAITRRSFLGGSAAVGLGTALAGVALPELLAACGAGATTPLSGGATRLPSYVAAKIPPPDAPGNSAGVAPGYWHQPTNLVRSVSKTPGNGGDVSALVITYSPPPTPLSSNRYWQELNRRLGVTLRPTIAAEGDFPAKLATTMAGNDLPDFILLTGSVPNELQFLQSKCEDLTPYLAGDAVKAYPNLANIPTYTWIPANLGGRIYGLPQDRGRTGSGLFIQQNLADQAGISQPANLDEFTRLLKDLTRPKSGRWAMGASKLSSYNLGFFNELFDVPNGWEVDKKGHFTADLETEQAQEAVAYMNGLFKQGIFHPDANNMTTTQSKNAFYAGQIATYRDGFSAFQTTWQAVAQVNPDFRTRIVVPFGRKGGRGRYFLGSGTFGVTALKKASPSRIKELLRVADYLAAPFGTEEYFFINNGIKGVDYTLDDHGNPVVTQLGDQEMTLPIGYGGHDYIAGPPWVYVDFVYPDFIKTVHMEMEKLIPLGVANPTVGLYSPTQAEHGADLSTLRNDQISAMVSGRSPLSSYKSFVQDWRSQGGNQVRKEYERAYASQHGKKSRG